MKLRYPFSHFFEVIVRKAKGADEVDRESMDRRDQQSDALDEKVRDQAAVKARTRL